MCARYQLTSAAPSSFSRSLISREVSAKRDIETRFAKCCETEGARLFSPPTVDPSTQSREFHHIYQRKRRSDRRALPGIGNLVSITMMMKTQGKTGLPNVMRLNEFCFRPLACVRRVCRREIDILPLQSPLAILDVPGIQFGESQRHRKRALRSREFLLEPRKNIGEILDPADDTLESLSESTKSLSHNRKGICP